MNPIRFLFKQALRLILNSATFRNHFRREMREYLLFVPKIVGPKDRLHLSAKSGTNNFLANTSSGHIWLEDNVFFGKNVCLITGTHDYTEFGFKRRRSFPKKGNDIKVHEGAWIATGAIILGPCVIGKHSVVAAGSVVVEDVPPYTIVGGVPAKIIKKIEDYSN